MGDDSYRVEKLVLKDFDGKDVGLVVAKATWTMGDDRIPRPADDPEPVLFAPAAKDDGDPSEDPLLFDADTVLVKPKTDFVVHAVAYAPGGVPEPYFDVEVTVGGNVKRLRVFGPRRALYGKGPDKDGTGAPLFTDPVPVGKVAVDYTNAYGGKAVYRLPGSEEVIEIPCPTNPLGKGYCVQYSREALEALELPQVEDPDRLLEPGSLVRRIGPPEDVPLPAGLGFVGSGWYPRVAYAGVMPHEVDEVRKQVRDQVAALDPEKDADAMAMLQDFEPPVMAPEFYQGASEGLALPYLDGDESVTLKNLSRDGFFGFNLPGRRPLVRLGAGTVVDAVLDTVVLLVEEARLVMTFRARIPLGDRADPDAFLGAPVEVRDVGVAEYKRAVAAASP